MPCISICQELLGSLNLVALHIVQARNHNVQLGMESDVDDSDVDVDSNQGSILKSIIISPPFPISPPISLDFDLDFGSESNSQDLDCMDGQDRPYWHLLSEIMALIDKVESMVLELFECTTIACPAASSSKILCSVLALSFPQKIACQFSSIQLYCQQDL